MVKLTGETRWKAPRQEDENPRKKARASSDEAKEELLASRSCSQQGLVARNQSLDRESTVNEESSWLLPSTELFEQLNHYQKKLCCHARASSFADLLLSGEGRVSTRPTRQVRPSPCLLSWRPLILEAQGVWKLHLSRSRGQHFWFNKVTPAGCRSSLTPAGDGGGSVESSQRDLLQPSCKQLGAAQRDGSRG